MHKNSWFRFACVSTIFALAAGLLSSCMPTVPLDCEPKAHEPKSPIEAELAIVVAPTTSFVDIELSMAEVRPVLNQILESQNAEITTVLADGAPSVFSRHYTDFSEAVSENDVSDEQAIAGSAALRLYRCVVVGDSTGVPVVPGSDLLAALRVAANGLDTDGLSHQILVVGNGLQVGGQLPLESLGLPHDLGQVNEVVDKLEAAGALPDLGGITVSFVGLGQVSGASQPVLNQQSSDILTALWQELVVRSGGEIGHITNSLANNAPSQNAIPIPSIPVLDNACLFTIGEADGYQFKPDSAVFVNEKLARTAAEKLKDNLEGADCTSPLNVTGYTASGVNRSDYVAGNAKEMALSLNRAKAFKALMVAVGITNKIAVTGGGKGPFSDWAADGTFDEQLGKRNRIVEISEQ